MKELNGSELVGYIKERQAKQIRTLRQAHKVFPRLAIIVTVDNPVIDTYTKLKQNYGADILIDVDIHKIDQSELLTTIDILNDDDNVHGIIIQLPLADPADTDEAVNRVLPSKDVDGLGTGATLDPATPTAINWLLAGYNVELRGKKIALVGAGRLVGSPLSRMWQASGYDVTVFDDSSTDLHEQLPSYDIIVSATGVPGLITSNDVAQKAVVVDAGTASEGGKIVGDVAPDVRERDDIKITPIRGGVGPLTVAALFDNVIRAAEKTAQDQSSSKASPQ